MFRLLPRAGALFAFIVGSAGCGGSDEDASSMLPAPPPTVSCMDDARLDSYTGELDKAGTLGLLSFRFFDLSPNPPAKGSNTFHVQVSDAAGAPMQGDLRVDLRMPDHGHGTSVEPVISFDPALGTYTVTPLYLFMPGVWRLDFKVFDGASASGDAEATGATGAPSASEPMLDDVVLHFCVEG